MSGACNLKDEPIAFTHLVESDNHGYPEAKDKICELAFTGYLPAISYLRDVIFSSKFGDTNQKKILLLIEKKAEKADEDALLLLQDFANTGNIAAKYFLWKYLSSKEISSENDSIAFKSLRCAADGGYEDAKYEIEVLAKNGNTHSIFYVGADYIKSLPSKNSLDIIENLFSKAKNSNQDALNCLEYLSDNDVMEACFFLGRYYYELGGSENVNRSAPYFIKSKMPESKHFIHLCIEQGSVDAIRLCDPSFFYNVNQDNSLNIFKILYESAKDDHYRFQNRLDSFVFVYITKEIKDLECYYSSARTGNSYASVFLKKIADAGSKAACFLMGKLYYEGKGVNLNSSESMKYFALSFNFFSDKILKYFDVKKDEATNFIIELVGIEDIEYDRLDDFCKNSTKINYNKLEKKAHELFKSSIARKQDKLLCQSLILSYIISKNHNWIWNDEIIKKVSKMDSNCKNKALKLLDRL
jgi:TPR repeat protein